MKSKIADNMVNALFAKRVDARRAKEIIDVVHAMNFYALRLARLIRDFDVESLKPLVFDAAFSDAHADVFKRLGNKVSGCSETDLMHFVVGEPLMVLPTKNTLKIKFTHDNSVDAVNQKLSILFRRFTQTK